MTTDGSAVEESVRELIGRAQQAIRRADYDRALNLLEDAVRRAPDDLRSARLLHQTQQAAHRHRAALERNRQCAALASKIHETVAAGDLARARRSLQQAIIDFGQHPEFEAVDREISELERTDELRRAAALAERAQTAARASQWQAALEHSNQALELAPDNRVAADVARQARERIHAEEYARQRTLAADEAADDVERMIGAQEFTEATVKLERAMTLHGRDHRRFDDLAAQLDQATSSTRAEQRVEWKTRRANEAADLVAQAARSNLRGDFSASIQQLKEASKLDPEIADLETKLANARSALEKQRASRRRGRDLQRRLQLIRTHLRWLKYQQAESDLRSASEQFGETPELIALRARLEHLRVADQPRGSLSHFDLQTMSSAYTWSQVVLFPFRSAQIRCFGIAVLIALASASIAVPAAAITFVLIPFAKILLITAVGRNSLTSFEDLVGNPQRWARLATPFLAAAGSAIPTGALVLSSRWHSLLAVDSGLPGWLLLAALMWISSLVFLLTMASIEIEGSLRLFGTMVREVLVATNALFSILVLIVLCQTSVWGIGASALIAAYGSLFVPHLVGVLLRRTAPLWSPRH